MISTNTSSSSTVVMAKAFDILKHVLSVVLSRNLNGDKTKADKPISLREGIILLTSKSATVMSYSPENLVTSFILKIVMRLNFRVSAGMVMIWAIIEDFFLDYQPNLNIRDLKNNLGNLQIIQYELQRNLNGDKTKADKPISLREGIILLTSKSATVMSYSPENLVTSFILKIVMRLNFRVSAGMVMIWAIIEDFFLDYQPNLNIRDLKNNLGNLQIIQYELQRVEFPFWKCVISLSQKNIMAQFHVD